MWYLILALLFGQGGQPTNTSDNGGHNTVQTDNTPGDGGDTSTPLPPRPPRP